MVQDPPRTAGYVVVERTHRHRLPRLVSGAIGTAPVLCVPPGWVSDQSGPNVVTVAVQDDGEVSDVVGLVGLAAGEAHARGAELVVLHAVAPGHDHDEAQVEARLDRIARAHVHLDGTVRTATQEHADLTVRFEVVLGHPADVLVHASSGSALLVVGRRHREHAWGTHLGPVVHRVLLDAACPVLLAPDRDTAAHEESARRPAAARERDHGPVPGDVVVAVGRPRAEGAVRFAVQEAGARGVGVHLVHVARMRVVDGASTAEAWRSAAAEGRFLLDRAVDVARSDGGPHLRVTHHLVERGSLVRDLVAESEHASVLVVQHRRFGRAHRRVVRSVTSVLGARTDVPVVAVPEAWCCGPERAGCVVAGLQDEDDAATVLPLALEEATRRALPLTVLHAGSLGPTDRTRLLARVEEVHRRYPAVTVRPVLKDEDPVDLLVGATTSADLVVIGRRRDALPRHSRLGPVAREVLDGSTCPVVLVPAAGPR